MAVLVGIVLICTNIALNMHYTYKYHLRIGFLDIANYYLLQSIIAKPWSKLQNMAQGVWAAMIYREILLYRQAPDQLSREARFPRLHRIHQSSNIGTLMIWTGVSLILVNLFIGWHSNNYPKDASDLGNALFYGFSRPTFVTGSLLILLSIFTGHFTIAQAALSTSIMRIAAKSLPLACTIVILAVQLLYCSQAMPKGFMITFPVALCVGLGLILATLLMSVTLMVFLEFPITRLLQLLLIRCLSHDELLRSWHEGSEALATERGEVETRPAVKPRRLGPQATHGVQRPTWLQTSFDDGSERDTLRWRG